MKRTYAWTLLREEKHQKAEEIGYGECAIFAVTVACIYKPFDISELVGKVKEALK